MGKGGHNDNGTRNRVAARPRLNCLLWATGSAKTMDESPMAGKLNSKVGLRMCENQGRPARLANQIPGRGLTGQ